MRRSSASYAAVVILVVAALVRYYPEIRRSLAPARRAVAPEAAPGGAAVEGPYFSDSDRVADRLVAAINRTQKSLHVAIYDLTHPDIAAALEAASRRGVEVRIVADQRQAEGTHSEIP